jgi:hypothetical protein
MKEAPRPVFLLFPRVSLVVFLYYQRKTAELPIIGILFQD